MKYVGRAWLRNHRPARSPAFRRGTTTVELGACRAMAKAFRDGDVRLCSARRAPPEVVRWFAEIEAWLAAELEYAGAVDAP